MYSPGDNELTFKTNDTRRLTLKSDKVGINVDSPSAHLHLKGGGANATDLRLENDDGYLQVSVDADKARYQADEHVFKNQADNATWATLNSTGLGINVTPSSHKLDVTGSARVTGALTVTAGITGTATKATDLDINAANKVLYQASNGDTSTLAAGTSGEFLQSNGASAPSWTAISTNGNVPIGGIIIWSGAANAIPTYWNLCNGSNGTPNLTDRFVIGAGNTYGVGNTGGSANAIAVSHTHTSVAGGTHSHGVTDSGHTHSYNSRSLGSVHSFGDSNQTRPVNSTSSATTGSSYSSISINNGGSHSHTINASGSSGTNANLPPYYALCYIMRTS